SVLCHFLFNASPPPVTYTLSLHDALPILQTFPSRLRPRRQESRRFGELRTVGIGAMPNRAQVAVGPSRCCRVPRGRRSRPSGARDRKSTRLNSSHRTISYAVFCLKKKKNT